MGKIKKEEINISAGDVRVDFRSNYFVRNKLRKEKK